MGVLKIKVGGVWTPVAQGVGISAPGLVGWAERTTDYTAAFPTQADVPGLSVSWTAVAGHVYRTTISMTVTQLTADGGNVIAICDAANGVKRRIAAFGAVNRDTHFTSVLVETGLSGATTRKVQIYTGSANQTKVTGASAYNPQIVVEDITYADMGGLVTPWQAPSFLNGWSNFGAPYSPAGYRKVGDNVQLRGLVKGGTTAALTPMFVLPAGYRPPTILMIATTSNSAFSEVRVYNDGTVYFNVGSAIHLSLENIQFPLTA